MKIGTMNLQAKPSRHFKSHVLPPVNSPSPFKWVSKGASPHTLFSCSSQPVLGKAVSLRKVAC